MFSWLKKTAIELLFPTFCCSCGRYSPYLCAFCFESLQFYGQPVLLKLDNPAIEYIIAAFEYQFSIIPVLHQLKYKSVKGIGTYLGELLFYTTPIPKTDLITFVPLHKDRQNTRGFNQAKEIATQLSFQTQTPLCNLLHRANTQKTQASITNRQERLHNLNGIFSLASPQLSERLCNKTILVIDDVTTTGSTLNECAKILKTAGASKVIGLVVAHGS